ncbi:hypothetical protein R2APBS1_3638 [Rhodanobacter denitrificans]|uniref:Uncharacterized protein n=1 Tax=Rhodanobacter denitrificans TaxID=666685 RepID=M4NM05_9GAMM|nr:hypothetical protein R2APBS1_3638 [Rhodanobacter denitrificans]
MPISEPAGAAQRALRPTLAQQHVLLLTKVCCWPIASRLSSTMPLSQLNVWRLGSSALATAQRLRTECGPEPPAALSFAGGRLKNQSFRTLAAHESSSLRTTNQSDQEYRPRAGSYNEIPRWLPQADESSRRHLGTWARGKNELPALGGHHQPTA